MKLQGLRVKFLFIFMLIWFCSNIYAENISVHSKLWLSSTLIGPLSERNKNLKYYLEPGVRLIDDEFVISQALLHVGLGYQIQKDLTPFFLYAYFTNINTSGDVVHENRITQQLNWDNIIKIKTLSLSSRARLQERNQVNTPGWAVRFRDRLIVKMPFQNWEKHSLMIFEEPFFNINHPSWVSISTFAENRAFIGIETEISKTAVIDFGYMNQYISGKPNQVNHVIYIALNSKS